MIRNYRAAGARRVIVNGVVDPALGMQPDLLGQAELMVCRLRADPEEVVRRFSARHQRGEGNLGEALQRVREECDRMDASAFADVYVDTTGVPAAAAARLVRDSCAAWPGFGDVVGDRPGAAPAFLGGRAENEAGGAGGRALLLCGPVGIGKSTIAFQLYRRCLRAGLTACYIDLDQIGFLRPPWDGDPGNHGLKAANLAAIWRIYHASGARHLVMTGPVENQAALQTYLAALSAAAVTVFRLHAGPAELRRRIMTRGEGGSWPQPGDPLRGQPASYLSQIARQAAADAHALDSTRLDAIRIGTDGRTAGESADLVAAAAGWPGQGRAAEVPHRTR